MKTAKHALGTIRCWITLFIVGLVISGVTAFPLLWELNLLAKWTITIDSDASSGWTQWILQVRDGLERTYARDPFIAYGTDWLAFGHIVIALFFVAPWIDPKRNVAVLWVGVVACILVIPTALICGAVREIPLGWRFIDCAFGIFGIIPLLLVIRLIGRLPAREPALEFS